MSYIETINFCKHFYYKNRNIYVYLFPLFIFLSLSPTEKIKRWPIKVGGKLLLASTANSPLFLTEDDRRAVEVFFL